MMSGYHKFNFRLTQMSLIAGAVLLASCSAPPRLTEEDINLKQASKVVQERMIAPKSKEERLEYELPQRQPRRTILQVLHHPSSLSNPAFVELLQQQISEEISFREAQEDNARRDDDAISAAPAKPLSEDERALQSRKRGEERRKMLFDRGVILEEDLYERLALLEMAEEALALEVIPGLSTENTTNIFGKNLTRDPNGYLSMPADMVFIGGRASNMPSKTALLANYVDDKTIQLGVRDMPLRDVLLLVSNAIGIQASLSNQIMSADTTVSLQLNASALSILDAVLTQHDLAISYDPDVEVARFYNDAELEEQLADVRQVIIAYNQHLFTRKKLNEVRADVGAVKDMIELVQQLMRGREDVFISEIDNFDRAGLGSEAVSALRDLSNEGFSLRQRLEQFDLETVAILNPESGGKMATPIMASVQSRFNNILIEDPCIIPGQEVFVEKIAVYNKESTEAQTYLEGYFENFQTQTTAELAAAQPEMEAEQPEQAAESETETVAAALVEALATENRNITLGLPEGCTTSPSLNEVSMQADSTGVIIQGTRAQNAIAVRLIEEDDTPQMQVLVEIFMVTVSRDFSRQLENLLRATDSAGGSGVTEADLLTNIASAISGGYTVNLAAPTNEITSALRFLETNQLGRVLSSPTILVRGDGGSATISREQVAEVLFSETVQNADNTTSIVDTNTTLTAPLSLELSQVQVLPANNNVKMDVQITNKRFLSNVTSIVRQEDADYTQDTINTSFTAAPGDVIVLAGLTANSDSTNTRGLPGTTTGSLAPVAGLLAGQDIVSNNVNEMVIFMAPTVFDPSADKQPHAPFQ